VRHLRWLVVGLTAVAFTILIPEGALGGPPYQPDVFVRGAVGEGVHNATGAGQFKRLRLRPDRAKIVPYWNRNDGANPDTFFYWGCAGTGPFRVKWRDWQGTNVTAQVVAGTFSTAQLGPGWSEGMLSLRVKARRSAGEGDVLRCGVLAISWGDGTQDQAGYRVVVTA